MSTNRPKTADPETSSTTGRQFVTVAGQKGASGEKPPIGYATAYLHLVKGYIGTGIFAMGEAFKNSGLILGPVLITVIAIMNLDCQHMIVKAAVKIADEEEEDVRPTFTETVEYTFHASNNKWLQSHSRRIGVATTFSICIAELGFCCVYFVFIAEHLIEITSHYGFLKINDLPSKHIMLAIILVPMWLSTFLGNLKLLLPLSIMSNLLMWTGIGIVFYFTTTGDRVPISELDLVSYKYLPMFFGTALFSFEGITFILPLRNEMKHPEKFVMICGVLNTAMTFVLFLLVLVGVLAFMKYGDNVASSVFLNLESDNQLARVTKCLISLSVLFTFTLHMYIPFEVTYPLFHRRFGPFKHELLSKVLYRSGMVLLTYTIANVIPFLGLFISLVGASTGSLLTLILPPVVDYYANQGDQPIIFIIKNVIIFLIGVIGAITGTVMSVHDIVMAIKNFYA